jgi:hypothetical protein
MSRKRSFSVEFDRSIAKARIGGNERLAAHLERIRPTLNLAASDEDGEVFANASLAFARDLIEVCLELKADPFDVLLILSGVCAHVLNKLHHDGIDLRAGTHALIKSLEQVVVRLEAHIAEQRDGG